MPATPAWPPKSTPRVFLDDIVSLGEAIRLDGPVAHYLLSVMRLKQGSAVKLFDDRSGEYLATITNAGKRDLTLSVDAHLRPRDDVPDLWLCQALIKKDRFDWVVEKSCELGIAHFVPILTSRCVVDRVKEDRLRGHMIEAAEQCERTALPSIAPLEKLSQMLKNWPTDRHLYYCDERGGISFSKALMNQSGPAAILVGPEGGFTDQEIALLSHHSNAVAVSLGPRILRADTAAVTAISVWMAINGDWS